MNRFYFIKVRYKGKVYKTRILLKTPFYYKFVKESDEHLQDRLLKAVKSYAASMKVDEGYTLPTKDIDKVFLDKERYYCYSSNTGIIR